MLTLLSINVNIFSDNTLCLNNNSASGFKLLDTLFLFTYDSLENSTNLYCSNSRLGRIFAKGIAISDEVWYAPCWSFMKRAIMILILAVLLSSCANNVKKEMPVTSFATTTATSSTATTTTKAVQTTPSVTTQNRYTTTAEASKTAVSAVSVSPETTTAENMTTQNRQTYVVYETAFIEVEQPEQTTQTEQVTTTSTTTAATTTTAPSVFAPATTSATHPTVEWSENMAVWRKLCEGRQLTETEQNIIRTEIQDYALTTFNGRQDIHVSFGTDEFDISFESPLELVVRNEMVGMENAHMDAYCDPN